MAGLVQFFLKVCRELFDILWYDIQDGKSVILYFETSIECLREWNIETANGNVVIE